MKRNLLSLAIAAAVAVPSVAMADATIYGKINLSVQTSEEVEAGVTTEDNFQLQNHSSRIGFKGDAELDYGLTAIYQMEFEVAPDDGSADGDSPFKQRDIFVGLKGGFGTIKLGKMDTPLKKAQGKVDVFSDIVDMKLLIDGENRMSDSINYTSPKFAKMVTVSATVIPGEDSGTGADEDDGIADSVSASVVVGDKKYKKQPFYAALAYDSDVKDLDTIRAVAGYKWNDLTLGALYQTSEGAESGSTYDEDGFLVSAAYKIEKFTLKGQYIGSDQDAKWENGGQGGEAFTLGVDYKLGKKTKTYVYYGTGENDAKDEYTYAGLGLEHKF